MTHALKRRAALILLAFVAIIGSLLVSNPTPANAAQASSARLLSCDYSWGSIPWHTVSWGRAKLCEVDGLSGDGVTNGGVWIKVQTQDILTDGWCVKVQYQYAGGWYDVPSSQSCGSIVTSGAADPPNDWSMTNIRLVRGQCTAPYTPGICVNYTNLYDLM